MKTKERREKDVEKSKAESGNKKVSKALNEGFLPARQTHTARIVVDQKRIHVLEWPSQRPEVNQNENVLKDVKIGTHQSELELLCSQISLWLKCDQIWKNLKDGVITFSRPCI